MHKQATIISGVRKREVPNGIPARQQDETSEERYLDCFCDQCWSFQIFRHNKDEVHDWSFLKESLKDYKVQDPELLEKGLKGPIKDSEMQKNADHYLKNNKTSGLDSFQTELIKTMPSEQLSLLNKGGPMVDQPTHWRPVVLLFLMNQLLVYIINERLMELVEHERILTQAQGGFRQDKRKDINDCKLGLTRQSQRLKRRFLRVDIDLLSVFNSMSQVSL